MTKIMRTFKVFLSIVYLITLFPLKITATTWDRAYIESFAKTYINNQIPPPLGGKISINVANIDPRIIIKPCQVPLKANIPENINRRNVNIKVTCDDSIAIKYVASNKVRGEKLTNIKEVLGSKAEKRIGKDRTITRKNVCLVCKGDVITIIAKSKGFMIKTQGTALSSGNLNQQIKVKNSRSGRVINPKINAVNQVIINL